MVCFALKSKISVVLRRRDSVARRAQRRARPLLMVAVIEREILELHIRSESMLAGGGLV
jgi:hypothetical protein